MKGLAFAFLVAAVGLWALALGVASPPIAGAALGAFDLGPPSAAEADSAKRLDDGARQSSVPAWAGALSASAAPGPQAARDRMVRAVAVATIGVRALRASLRDPDSFVAEQLYFREPAEAVCIWYRARNGFGGYNREFAIVVGEKFVSHRRPDFDKYCSGTGFVEIAKANWLF